jgi:hypothetical protein
LSTRNAWTGVVCVAAALKQLQTPISTAAAKLEAASLPYWLVHVAGGVVAPCTAILMRRKSEPRATLHQQGGCVEIKRAGGKEGNVWLAWIEVKSRPAVNVGIQIRHLVRVDLTSLSISTQLPIAIQLRFNLRSPSAI